MNTIEIKVTLEDIEPEVQRVLQVPANIRLDRLHLIVQAAMGWTNSHLYKFEAGGAPNEAYGFSSSRISLKLAA